MNVDEWTRLCVSNVGVGAQAFDNEKRVLVLVCFECLDQFSNHCKLLVIINVKLNVLSSHLLVELTAGSFI